MKSGNIDRMMSKNCLSLDFSPANESLYLFGGNYDGIWTKMSKAYSSPPCKYCDKAGVETFGIGFNLNANVLSSFSN